MPGNERENSSFESVLKKISEKLRKCAIHLKKFSEDNAKVRVNEIRGNLEFISGELISITQELGALGEFHGMVVGQTDELRARVEELKEAIDKLTAPPLSYATVISVQDDGTADVMMSGRRMRVYHEIQDSKETIAPGMPVLVNEASVIVGIGQKETRGDVCTVDSVIDETRIRVVHNHDEKRVFELPATLHGQKFSAGDELLCNVQAGMILERLEKSENKELWLEEVQPIEYEEIGGLQKQVNDIREEIEMPFLHKKLFQQYDTEMAKGILLYGPPGCGKTLIARAVAWHLAKELAEKHGQKKIKGYFINVKGPELLNKYVGETERQIREMFARAKERASESCPVIIFIDEADALLKTRGTGISSDVEMTTVAQFLPELDGIDAMKNVLVMLASNRQDLIDPAVLRAGRVDRKIKVTRPDRDGAKEIFRIYLTRKQIPLHQKYTKSENTKWKEEYEKFKGNYTAITEYLIDGATKRLWAMDEDKYAYTNEDGKKIEVRNSILELTLQGGAKHKLHLRDFASGALIKNIVRRAKRNAIKRVILQGPEEGGLLLRDLCVAIEQELVEIGDLPNTDRDAQNWLDMENIKERVVHVDSLIEQRRKEHEEAKPVEEVKGTYYF